MFFAVFTSLLLKFRLFAELFFCYLEYTAANRLVATQFVDILRYISIPANIH